MSRSRSYLASRMPLTLAWSLAGPASPRSHSPPMPCWEVSRPRGEPRSFGFGRQHRTDDLLSLLGRVLREELASGPARQGRMQHLGRRT